MAKTEIELQESRSLAPLSEVGGLAEEGTVAVPISSEILDGGLREIATPRDKLQEKTLSPIVRFFCFANAGVAAAICIIAVIELFLPSGHQYIVTDKVLIALISGLTLQGGAVIIAAFKGLFAHSPDSRRSRSVSSKPGGNGQRQTRRRRDTAASAARDRKTRQDATADEGGDG